MKADRAERPIRTLAQTYQTIAPDLRTIFERFTIECINKSVVSLDGIDLYLHPCAFDNIFDNALYRNADGRFHPIEEIRPKGPLELYINDIQINDIEELRMYIQWQFDRCDKTNILISRAKLLKERFDPSANPNLPNKELICKAIQVAAVLPESHRGSSLEISEIVSIEWMSESQSVSAINVSLVFHSDNPQVIYRVKIASCDEVKELLNEHFQYVLYPLPSSR